MRKQDRQGVRTPADIERKYSFGEYKKSYNEARRAQESVSQVEQTLRTDFSVELSRLQTEISNTDSILNDHFLFEDGYVTILGGIKYSLIADGTDLDYLLTPNKYIGSGDYINCPATSGTFLMDVENCGDAGQLLQRITTCHKDATKVYIRFYYYSTWGDWYCVFDATRVGMATDSGWKTLTVDSAFKVRNDDDSLKPVYKVTGNVVTVCGVVANVAQMASTSSGVVFASGIPEAYRPHMDHHVVCQGSGMNKWVCSVKTDGTLVLSRYGITEQGTIPANSWLPFTVTYQF